MNQKRSKKYIVDVRQWKNKGAYARECKKGDKKQQCATLKYKNGECVIKKQNNALAWGQKHIVM